MGSAVLGHSVELADIRVGDACGRSHWDLRWSSLRGHETFQRCAAICVADACGRPHWDLRWNSLWGHEEETCEGYAEMFVAGACCGRWEEVFVRWSSLLWGYETREGRADAAGVGDACGRRQWTLEWRNSLWGHE